MQSHLTRLVFRNLLNGRQIIAHDCPFRFHRDLKRARCLGPPSSIQHVQRRMFWNSLWQQPSDQLKAKETRPGLKTMQDLTEAEMRDSRRPDVRMLRRAFTDFFVAMGKNVQGLDEVAAGHVLRTLTWLIRNQVAQETGGDTLTTSLSASPMSLKSLPVDRRGLKIAIEALTWARRREATVTHQSLADILHTLAVKALDGVEGGFKGEDVAVVIRLTSTMLCRVGRLSNAFEFLDQAAEKYSVASSELRGIYSGVFQGLNLDKAPEADIEMIRQHMAKRNIENLPSMRQLLVQYYAQNDQLQKALKQLELPLPIMKDLRERTRVSSSELIALLECCIRLRDEKAGRMVLKRYFDQDLHRQSAKVWLRVFIFAAMTGRGADEVERMMDVMEKTNRDGPYVGCLLDVTMINELVKFAVQSKDSYLAERFIALGEKRGIQPNTLTYIHQMTSRLDADDIDGARAAYERTRSLPKSKLQGDCEDVNAMNRLIQAMCETQGRYTFESIMNLVDELNARPKAQFHPATVACLTTLHLRREEYHDVVDLLQKYASSYDVSERHIVRDAMVKHCLDLRNSVARVWESYQILRRNFDAETPREVRTKIMNLLYRRGRADMAFYVFSHMRDSPNSSARATQDTYVDALLGIAKCKDEETLEYVHNQLKLDPQLEPDTRLNNALMLAYIGVGDPRRALDFWEEIAASREGPSIKSILIVLQACQKKPFGLEEARPIWNKIIGSDMEVTKPLFTAWVACLAGNGYTKESMDMLRKATGFDIEVDDWILGSVFNACPSLFVQRELLSSMYEEYPKFAEKFRSTPHSRNREGALVHYDIERSLKP